MPRVTSHAEVDWNGNVLVEYADEGITQLYQISRKCAKQSELFSTIILSQSRNTYHKAEQISIPIRPIKLDIVDLVMEYMEYHEFVQPTIIDKPLTGKLENIVDGWDYAFFTTHFSPIGSMGGTRTLLAVLAAAHYLSIQSLVDFCCAAVASLMKGKTPERLREMFNLADDFTPPERKRLESEASICNGDG
ncbi:Cyclin A/CDK2-associated protein [Perkinsela sp. CCAP 1560/4]|nr:Cyclin A/CDK2-associated protein [Perkinsela sp. CCAP 1560/4]|eukprot:KNH07439.1 Cyclin A/CDK2-associated protein [Perkinsela sp. CCAP 1560/4]